MAVYTVQFIPSNNLSRSSKPKKSGFGPSSLACRSNFGANPRLLGIPSTKVTATRWKSQALHPSCCQRLPELLAELRIAVVQHVPMLAQIPGRLVNRVATHLCHPLFRSEEHTS